MKNYESFGTDIGAPSRLADYDIDDSKLDLMVDKAMGKQESFGKFKTLNREDVQSIYRASL